MQEQNLSGSENWFRRGTRANVQLISVLYLLAFVSGGLTAIIGLVMAYVNRDQSDAVSASHYTFMIMTFWNGLIIIAIGFVVAITVILIPLSLLIWTLSTLWWIIRCVQSLTKISDGRPINQPNTFFFDV